MGLMTPWTVASQVPLSMDFSRQEYWNRLPFPSPEDHLDPGIEPRSPTLQADCLLFESRGKPWYPKLRNLALFYVWEDARVWKMQESGLPEIIPFLYIAAALGQYPVYFTSWAPLGLTTESGWTLMAVRQQIFSFLSTLRAHQLILVVWNRWWLVTSLFTDMAGNISFLKMNIWNKTHESYISEKLESNRNDDLQTKTMLRRLFVMAIFGHWRPNSS